MNEVEIKTALISVYDKEGIEEFAQKLVKIIPDIKILSSGGTYQKLRNVIGSNLIEVSDYTGFAEMPGGLVKTLHPKIHAGILQEGTPDHKAYMDYHKINDIQLIVVNLYPFEKAIEGSDSIENARKNIDIGGVTLTYAGSKNFLKNCVITDKSDYAEFLKTIENNKGKSTLELRQKLSKKSFARVAQYLSKISEYFSKINYNDLVNQYK